MTDDRPLIQIGGVVRRRMSVIRDYIKTDLLREVQLLASKVAGDGKAA